MAKLSGITTPSLTYDEGAAPSTPASAKVVTYAKADGLMYSKDDAGVETLMSGVAGGSGGFVEQSTVKLTSGNPTTSSTTFVDATGLSVTITTAAVRCLVMFSAMANNSNAGNSVYIDLDIDGTRHGNTTNGLTGATGTTPWNVGFTVFSAVLSAASHTFKIQFRATATTGGIVAASATNPAILTVIETNLTT